jgi:16S rRNA (cytosine967-C5)-methyltransferase
MQNKLYPNLVKALYQLLEDIIIKNRYADKALESTFKINKKWGSRDRHFIASNVYDIIRYRRLLNQLSGREDDPESLFVAWYWLKNGQLPDTFLSGNYDQTIFEERKKAAEKEPAIVHSFPDWMVEIMAKDHPQELDNLMAALNQEAEVAIRCNTLKCTVDQLIKQLSSEGITINPVYPPHGFVLESRANVFRTKAFQNGWFEVQDISSQIAGLFVLAQPGMQIIDACAGAGGKSLQLSAHMLGKGRLLSMDVEEWKLKELKKRAARAGAGNIETRHIEGSKTIKRLHQKADKLVLDVPCSGSGVIRRNPDTKWKITPERLQELIKVQQEILQKYSQMVKKEGELIYITCSIFDCENRGQIDQFLNSSPNFQFVEDKSLFPDTNNYDGFYMCRLKRSQTN